MRALAYLAMLGVAIACVVWAIQRWRYRSGEPARLRFQRPAPVVAADPQARATLAYGPGPDRGAGVLRLSPSQLIFTGDSGRVLVIERLDITGATTTRALPDRDVAQPVLAVATRTDAFYFAVATPTAWQRLLT